MEETYWSYWIHRIQQLWEQVETLSRRMDALEAKMAASGKEEETPLSEKELTVCMALKEIGTPSTVEEVNAYLRESRHIDESVKETLMVRLKGTSEKGYAAYDQRTKRFSLAKESFVVK